jgi:hypothetical protein
MSDLYDSKEMAEALREVALFGLCESPLTAEQVIRIMKVIYQGHKADYTEEQIERDVHETRGGKRERPKRNISAEIEHFVTSVTSEGGLSLSVTLLSRDVTSELGFVTPEDKAAARKAFQRLVQRGILENVRNKSGQYRTVNGDLRKINLSDTSDLLGELPIEFPLGVDAWIKPMPHTVYIIAGETDAGKSAYLMQFAKMNYQRIPVHYYSSEMGKAEFLDRLQYFWSDAGTAKGMHFYERSEAFQDAIKRNPNHIHIIDYLELFDNFYLMAEEINKIEKALKNGIAFIALQKMPGRDSGLGGERTKNLPRLYLSMSPGKLKITKAKNWRNPKSNPNGQVIKYKLIDGCKFVNETPWEKEFVK